VRRVVAKVEFDFGELFSQVRFVTNLTASDRAVVRLYNRARPSNGSRKASRGRDDGFSCHRFRANEVR
jgi:hypothetical protein